LRGTVIAFDPVTDSGAISSADGNRYDFVIADWYGLRGPPRPGDVVEFQPQGQRAIGIEPEYVKTSFDRFYFSYRGRISRSEFWFKWMLPFIGIGLIVIMIVLLAALQTSYKSHNPLAEIYDGFFSYLIIFTGATIWTESVVLAKRIHDRNKPGWLVFLCLVPRFVPFIFPKLFPVVFGTVGFVVSIWFLIEFGCLQGTIGPNRYGPDPLRRADTPDATPSPS
jgi:uncharacterized membrane protein YhaH (DUF805 family)